MRNVVVEQKGGGHQSPLLQAVLQKFLFLSLYLSLSLSLTTTKELEPKNSSRLISHDVKERL
jgi:hypothetical protein